METLAPPNPEADPAALPAEALPPQPDPNFVAPEVPVDAVADSDPSRLQRFTARAKKIAVGEGVGTALEAGMLAVGVPLPARELAGTTIDAKTYSPDAIEDQEAAQPTRLRKVGRVGGILVLNLVTGYAAARYGPELAEHVSNTFSHGAGETASQLASKVGAMSGATAVFNRKFH